MTTTTLKTTGNIIKMSEMKAGDIGRIIDKDNEIIMRTASVDNFEVMVMNNISPDKCFCSRNCTVEIELFPKGTEFILTA